MTQPEALRLADALRDSVETDGEWSQEQVVAAAAELRRLSAVEAELLAMRRVFSEAGCTFDVNYIRRLVRAEAQRDALLEALKELTGHTNKRFTGGVWDRARAAIKAVEGENT